MDLLGAFAGRGADRTVLAVAVHHRIDFASVVDVADPLVVAAGVDTAHLVLVAWVDTAAALLETEEEVPVLAGLVVVLLQGIVEAAGRQDTADHQVGIRIPVVAFVHRAGHPGILEVVGCQADVDRLQVGVDEFRRVNRAGLYSHCCLRKQYRFLTLPAPKNLCTMNKEK